MRKLVSALLACLLLGAPASAAEPAPRLTREQVADKGLFDAMAEAALLIADGAYENAYARLKPIATDRRLDRSPPEMQYDARVMLGATALHTQRNAEAIATFRKLAASPLDQGYGLYLLASAATADVAPAETAADAITQLADRRSEWLAHIQADVVRIAYARVLILPDGEQRRVQMAKALLDANWSPPRPFDDFSDMWVELAAALLEQGDERGAAIAALRVSDPSEIITMRADKRFDAIVRPNEGSFDPRRAALSNVEILRRASSKHPDDLRGVVALADALRTVGKSKEALELVERTLETGTLDPMAFPEWERDELWLLHARAETLSGQGKSEEALKVYYDVAAMPEYVGGNTSHALNYGSQLVLRDHPREALQAIAAVDRMTPYGQTVKLWISICAHAQLDEMDAALREWSELKALETHNASAVYTAAVCLDDLDTAAGILIRQLRDPRLRGSALYQLQQFGPPPKAPPAEHRTPRQIRSARYEAIEARADVLAEVEKVGRIERYDLRADPR